MRNILVTGCAGFIGYHTSSRLLKKGKSVIGIDIIEKKKKDSVNQIRLEKLKSFKNFSYYKININNKIKIFNTIKNKNIYIIIHLAAKAGVRQSYNFPERYFKNNIVGFFNLIEAAKQNNISHFIYASSSSVYGEQKDIKFKENLNTDKPISFYAATKKINEVIAYNYSVSYNLPTTGLRFFTVYGPFGREDMSYFKFTNSIINNKKVFLFNKGNNLRDYTYIDDVVKSILKIYTKPSNKKIPFNVFNIGRGKRISIIKFLKIIENILNKKAIIIYEKAFTGDVKNTMAKINFLNNHINYQPNTDVTIGLKKYIKWYKTYYK